MLVFAQGGVNRRSVCMFSTCTCVCVCVYEVVRVLTSLQAQQESSHVTSIRYAAEPRQELHLQKPRSLSLRQGPRAAPQTSSEEGEAHPSALASSLR